MTGYHSKRRRASKALLSVLSKALPAALGLAGGLSILLVPRPVSAEQALEWARVDFLRNRVQLVPSQQRARRARISDILGIGDSLRTARSSRAELRFNDGSLARIGERATFRFTPNTRNFQLTNGTALLLIPPERGRSTIQTPNAVTGIQGSALFVRYIPETNTTIVGALTDNPDGPMVLFNRDGSEQQALRANEIGVIEGDQITQLYQFDGELFWQSSGLAEGFNYLNDSSSTGSDALDAVRQEIRDAIANKPALDGNNVIENPSSFSLPSPDEAPAAPAGDADLPASDSPDADLDTDFVDEGLEEEAPLEFENTPADEYLNSSTGNQEDRNSLETPQPASTEASDEKPATGNAGTAAGEGGDGEADPEEPVVEEPRPVDGVVTEEVNVKPDIAPGVNPSAGASSGGSNAGGSNAGGSNSDPPVAGGNNTPDTSPVSPSAGGSGTTGGTPGTNNPLAAPTAIMEEEPSMEEEDPEDMSGVEGSTPNETPGEGSTVNDGQMPPDDASPTDSPDGENQDVTGGAVDDGTTVPPADSAEDPTGESPGSEPVNAGGSDASDASNGGASDVTVPVDSQPTDVQPENDPLIIDDGSSQPPDGQSANPLIIDDENVTPAGEDPVPVVPTETVAPVEESTPEPAAPVETTVPPVVESAPEPAAPVETTVPPVVESAPEPAAPIEETVPPVVESAPELAAPIEETVPPVVESAPEPAAEVLVIPAETEIPETESLIIPDTETVPEVEPVSVNENFLDVSDVVDDPLMTDPMTEMTESMNNSMDNMDDGDNGNGDMPGTVPTPTDAPADNPATNGADNPATNGADNPATNDADNPSSPATSGPDNPAPTDDRPTN